MFKWKAAEDLAATVAMARLLRDAATVHIDVHELEDYVQAMDMQPAGEGFIGLGWRGWHTDVPSRRTNIL